MERPTVGGIFRAAFDRYAHGHGLTLDQHKAGRALMACRTEALGGYDEHCPNGDYEARRYHSCRNRSCPQCNRAMNRQQTGPGFCNNGKPPERSSGGRRRQKRWLPIPDPGSLAVRAVAPP